eukprot:CAMPEP_0118858912 /NCGR_PEP_ID=MMETSP1163-20130328/5382_1 /TAXON_ID=124430 /ORGANISM="Phaeomonas parva, Strain CCMP2877" /LENGTH=82 /DNA_ID=CAMNT_0006792421 /DNA_START=177 /DNA_END=426 /DNA_ORIENTATION=+
MARGFALGFGGKMGQQMWRDDCTGKSNGIRGTQVSAGLGAYETPQLDVAMPPPTATTSHMARNQLCVAPRCGNGLPVADMLA